MPAQGQRRKEGRVKEGKYCFTLLTAASFNGTSLSFFIITAWGVQRARGRAHTSKEVGGGEEEDEGQGERERDRTRTQKNKKNKNSLQEL